MHTVVLGPAWTANKNFFFYLEKEEEEGEEEEEEVTQEEKEDVKLHALVSVFQFIMKQSYICALIAMMVSIGNKRIMLLILQIDVSSQCFPESNFICWFSVSVCIMPRVCWYSVCSLGYWWIIPRLVIDLSIGQHEGFWIRHHISRTEKESNWGWVFFFYWFQRFSVSSIVMLLLHSDWSVHLVLSEIKDLESLVSFMDSERSQGKYNFLTNIILLLFYLPPLFLL